MTGGLRGVGAEAGTRARRPWAFASETVGNVLCEEGVGSSSRLCAEAPATLGPLLAKVRGSCGSDVSVSLPYGSSLGGFFGFFLAEG